MFLRFGTFSEAGDDWALGLLMNDLSSLLLVLAATPSAVFGAANRKALDGAWLGRRQCGNKQLGGFIAPGDRSAACGAIDVGYAATDH
jgi:hypothetical protein